MKPFLLGVLALSLDATATSSPTPAQAAFVGCGSNGAMGTVADLPSGVDA